MTTTDLATYTQAIAFQASLVNRAMLPRTRIHDIADAYETVRDTVCIHCTCGAWLQYPADGSERLYAVEHIARALTSAVAA